jgi:hypothetical protein
LRRRGGRAPVAWLSMLALAACEGEFRFDERPDASDAAAIDAPPSGCATDVDCPLPSLHCNPDNGACIACLSDTHCTNAALPDCDPILHRCVECSAPRDCAADQTCELTTHRCIGACRECFQCPTSSRGCDESRRICVACVTNQDCVGSPNGTVCDPTNALCVECTSDNSCAPPRAICDRTRGRCVACLSAHDCAADAPVCDPSTWQCVTGH